MKRLDDPFGYINVEKSPENRHKIQAECRSAAVKFIFQSDCFKYMHVQLDFQNNMCLQTTKFTHTVM